MRHIVRFLVLVAAVVVLGSSRQTASAQPRQPVVALDILEEYVLPRSATPPGFREESLRAIPNHIEAALRSDPDRIQLLVDRERIIGAEQVFEETGGEQPMDLELTLTLFSTSGGAQEDLTDTVAPFGFALTRMAGPALGDASVAFQMTGTGPRGPVEVQGAGFTVGRLQVIVQEYGLPGRPTQDDVLPLLRAVAERAVRRPPPPTSESERAFLRAQASPQSILYYAYEMLLGLYLVDLSPREVLMAAYVGARNALTAAGVPELPPPPQITSDDPGRAWTQFFLTYQELERLAGTVELGGQGLAYAAAAEMYGHLNNCHTAFFTPPVYRRFITSLRGQATAGLGITLTPEPPLTILRILPGTPAEEAGLRPGDEVVAIDGVTSEQVGAAAFRRLLRGEAGAPVTLTINRRGVSEPFEVTVVRRLIEPIIVRHRILAGGIGYIEFNDFITGERAVDEIRAALADFAAADVRGIVMDLRYNGGGSGATLQRVAGLFVPSGSRIETSMRQDGTRDVRRSIGVPVTQQPLVLLTGPATGSAAEIMALSLRDLGRASIVGSQTAGCVNGGFLLGLLDTSGVIVSAGQVLSGPNEVPLEDVGVTPDVPVDLTIDDLVDGRDPQLEAAIAVLEQQSRPAAAVVPAWGLPAAA